MIIRHRTIWVVAIALTSLLVIATTPQAHVAKQPEPIHVIFDMNGVLVTEQGQTKILGIKPFILYALRHTMSLHNPLDIKQTLHKKLFDFMHEVQPTHAHDVAAYDSHGNPLPAIMCDWLKGTQSCQQIRQTIQAVAQKKPHSIEQQIVTSICQMIFTPEQFIKTQCWVQETLDFVTELKGLGVKVYILSNWDPESFDLMRTTYHEIFALFDGIMISGDPHIIKPDPAIYQHMLATFNIDRTRAFFIDDQEPNIQAAQNSGITSTLCKPQKGLLSSSGPDIKRVKKEFYTWQEQMNYPDFNLVPETHQIN